MQRAADGTGRPVDWGRVETVLLDMDGTLLDLHFDNHFWLEHVPRRYAEARGLPLEQAREVLMARYRAVEGTMQWYCIDYWSRELGLDIARLKEEVAHLIAVHPGVVPFLRALRASGRRAVLVTNAHGRSLELKLRRTRLGRHLDAVVCAHDLGEPKESAGFWPRLRRREPFDPEATLLIDDNPAVLAAAHRYGIGQLLAVRRPDSRRPPRCVAGYAAVDGFAALLPVPPRG
ncbi:GMP/IMP nucleotidase [Inmirania thermothiophila]|uniref:Putative hydrolase of the HAD superfamily n=1 Tax=Inmirania thermothiophila TaxID=1750597 RepID=A0A3N1XSE2_9GAMM|nr:GMP/IMP nucleotidase [Inmirania thermothiophila]ROR29559.1 putative hydrolase of the HAD superfamily [Inmirania thermothiophila]